MKNSLVYLLLVLLLNGCSHGGSTGSAESPLQPERNEIVLQEGNADELVLGVELAGGGDAAWNFSLDAADSADLRHIHYWFSDPSQSSGTVTTHLNIRLHTALAPLQAHRRELWLVADSGEISHRSRLQLEVKPVQLPDVYLLIGQSNMEGYGELGAKNAAPGGPDQPHQRIMQLNVKPNDIALYPTASAFSSESTNTTEPLLVQAEDPLHQTLPADRTSKGGSYIGVGLSFAKEALQDTTQTIYLAPAAWSGTGFCANANNNAELAWNASASSHAALGGSLLADRALTRLNITLRETGGVFRGIVWHQGESDSHDSYCAEQYGDNLKNLIARIRREALQDIRGAGARGDQAAIPLVLGTMSKGQDARGDYSLFTDNKFKIDAVHRSIAQLIPHADYSNNDDLVPPAYPCGQDSCIHFGAQANRERGKRLYRALRRVVARQ